MITLGRIKCLSSDGYSFLKCVWKCTLTSLWIHMYICVYTRIHILTVICIHRHTQTTSTWRSLQWTSATVVPTCLQASILHLFLSCVPWYLGLSLAHHLIPFLHIPYQDCLRIWYFLQSTSLHGRLEGPWVEVMCLSCLHLCPRWKSGNVPSAWCDQREYLLN